MFDTLHSKTRQRRDWRWLALISLLVSLVTFYSVSSSQAREKVTGATQMYAQDKIELLVLNELAEEDQTDFFIWMAEKADLGPAYALGSKAEKGQFVFDTLHETAERTQRGLRAYLDERDIDYRPFYIANKILVRSGDRALVMAVAARPDVASITANRTFKLQEPFIHSDLPARQPTLIESNIIFVRADEVWALGYTGEGIVLAGNDSGLDWDHPALINQYRGWNGTAADHDYNWWDATDTYPLVPGDGHGHGTHTTGIMVGDDDSSNRIGIAPGARTMHCKNLADSNYGSNAWFTECFEWDLAPWDLNGANPDPSKAPHVVSNSWGYFAGNYPAHEDEIAALRAAGILVEAIAGNYGPDCATLWSPGDYVQSLTTGSIDHLSDVPFPGAITFFSSRGPSDLYSGEFMPDVMAPGELIRSSLPGGTYAIWSGTSMAGPHVVGLVGLMWEANPALVGDVPATEDIIVDTAVPLVGQSGSDCGGDYTNGPNNDWGYGTIDALAAVNEALDRAAILEYAPETIESLMLMGEVTTSTLTISNTGTLPFDFSLVEVEANGSGALEATAVTKSEDAAWLTTVPDSGTLASGESIEISVIFDSTDVTQAGRYTAMLHFEGTFADQVSPATLTMNVGEIEYEVSLEPERTTEIGDPGTDVEYDFTITNLGNISDSFSLSLGGHIWDANLSIMNTGSLAPGDSASVTLTHSIPSGVGDGEADTIAISADSDGDSDVSDTAQITTTAKVKPIYAVNLSPPNQTGNGVPGTDAAYEFTVTNLGDTSDSFSLSLSDYTWDAAVPTAHTGLLAPGDTFVVTLIVGIPAEADDGDADSVTISAFSDGDATASDTAQATTTATIEATYLYVPFVSNRSPSSASD